MENKKLESNILVLKKFSLLNGKQGMIISASQSTFASSFLQYVHKAQDFQQRDINLQLTKIHIVSST